MTAPAQAFPIRVDVTQSDRDVAEAIVSHVRGYGVRLPNDNHTAIQLVARHRLAHTALPDAGDEDVERVDRESLYRMIDGFADFLTFDADQLMKMRSRVRVYCAMSKAAAMREGVDRGMVAFIRSIADLSDSECEFIDGVGKYGDGYALRDAARAIVPSEAGEA